MKVKIVSKPTLLMKDNTIKIISLGSDHAFLVKSNGQVYSFGLNRSGFYFLSPNFLRFVF